MRIHGYRITWREQAPRDELRTTLVAAPNPAAASQALRASLGGAEITIEGMEPTHHGMPTYIK